MHLGGTTHREATFHRNAEAERRMATCEYHISKTSLQDDKKRFLAREAPSYSAEAPSPSKPSAPRERSNFRDIERLCISKLWNDFAHDLSENRTHAAREFFDLLVHCS